MEYGTEEYWERLQEAFEEMGMTFEWGSIVHGDIGPMRRAVTVRVGEKGIRSLDKTVIEWIRQGPKGNIRLVLECAKDAAKYGHLLYTDDLRRDDEERAAALQREYEERELREKRASERGPKPEVRLIRTPRDAELAAEAWMKYFGFGDAAVTPLGADGGIDVDSARAVAQVKAYMVPVGRPEIQNLAGVAAVEGKVGFFFALNGYTTQAVEWGTKAKLALFTFDLQGVPEPVNDIARTFEV
jgi:hypothetical protein